MWRVARRADDVAIVEMCGALNREDPGPSPVSESQIRRTLETLRAEPVRGIAVVLEVDGQIAGYAFLISFWSNEFGGEICEIDELFVVPSRRNAGHGQALFAALKRGELWPGPAVATSLIVRPDNARALELYERLGFEPLGTSMIRQGSPRNA
ncbi:MAG: N-acetyltransferase family protein [Kofleriaceae bacterium]